ncbi:MAG: hypothetical protein R3E42_00955 [Burkholderiaceae bacterium]
MTGALFAATTFLALAAPPQSTGTPHSKPVPAHYPSDTPTDPDTDWIPCAREFQTCYTPGPAQVRFGGGGRYNTTRNVVGEIECTIPAFGGDPARRVPRCASTEWVGPKARLFRFVRPAVRPGWNVAKRKKCAAFKARGWFGLAPKALPSGP